MLFYSRSRTLIMLWKAVTLLGLAICALGEKPATSEQMLKQEFVLQHGHHGELNHIGSHVPEHHEEYAWAYPSYEFSYTVNDPHTHDHKGQYEHRKGDEVKGEYWLLQPDGKKRTVKYESNKHMGFKAHVHYSEHPEHHEEPHVEEIIKPVIEIVPEKPAEVEEMEPIVVEIPEAVVEEREEIQEPEPVVEHIEPVHKPKQHKPIHIEYYINHKYQNHHPEEHEDAEPVEERREEEAGQAEEARIQEAEEPHEEIKYRKPVHIEHYAKIHHPIHNEHHGHEIDKHIVRNIVIHHDDHEDKYGHKVRELKEKRVHEEQHRPQQEHHRGRDEHREHESHAWRDHRLPVPLKHEPYYGIRQPERHNNRKYEAQEHLHRLHKPVYFQPENAHHHPRSLRQNKA